MEDISQNGTESIKVAAEPTSKPSKKSSSITVTKDQPSICLTLLRLDPILQFLTRATGKPLVPLKMIKATLPSANDETLQHIHELAFRHGVLELVGVEPSQLRDSSCLCWNHEHVFISFPSPPSIDNSQNKMILGTGTLHGSTKAAAKRRLATLRKSLKKANVDVVSILDDTGSESVPDATLLTSTKDWTGLRVDEHDEFFHQHEDLLEEEIEARKALRKIFSFAATNEQTFNQQNHLPTSILPGQASYAGSNPARESSFQDIDPTLPIPSVVLDAFDIDRPGESPTISKRRKLYSHQAAAIESAMSGVHTLVCTGTGSGKSLCFLVPVLAAAVGDNETSLLLFPTKALAQDQMTKLCALLRKNAELQQRVRPGIIDGDTQHADRDTVAKNCNIIMTNPDTMHAAILPGWKTSYKSLLGRIKYVVIDEAHMYEGVFGAHVAMVLARFMRLAAVCSHSCGGKVSMPTFLACSATMFHPEHHFRLLCPIAKVARLKIISPDEDGSPRAAKHFFVWNPPIMDVNGFSTGRVTVPKLKGIVDKLAHRQQQQQRFEEIDGIKLAELEDSKLPKKALKSSVQNGMELFRRHAADETAFLLARAVSRGVRCIAFCTTRCLVEWVYERAILALKSNPSTAHCVNQIETYRGGYTMEVRRSIESRLFNNDLLGVVGTNALELGVDVGGIDLTLHCGYPRSYASLLQQAGRAGRGAARLEVPSVAVMVCFNSPAEQQIWKRPRALLCRRSSALVCMPVNVGLVQGHLLCAGEEYPLMATDPVSSSLEGPNSHGFLQHLLRDSDLFGSDEIYEASIEGLLGKGMLKEESIPVAYTNARIVALKTHPLFRKAWTRVNLRSIEPINYAIVDLSHPMQRGKMDSVYDQSAVLDNIPYSRIFYHAFPGAIITHRGKRYKVKSMTRPPVAFDSCYGFKGGTFAAYALPTSARYTTRPLSSMKITIVKQMDRVDIDGENTPDTKKRHDGLDHLCSDSDHVEFPQDSLAGNGVLTVCRTVHGYKKLSPITRVELSRSEFCLPSMQFDTFGFWLDTEASLLRPVIKDYDEGVHALSHAILGVAPLFVPCGGSDLNCDHAHHDCTRIAVFDVRAGGSGLCAELFKHIFVPDGILETAIDLMENCAYCRGMVGYEGGCPSCLHFGHCLNFNQDLNRAAAIQVGKRLLARVKNSALFKMNSRVLSMAHQVDGNQSFKHGRKRLHPEDQDVVSPRRKSRDTALRHAKEVAPTKQRSVVMGRACWPTQIENFGHQVDAD